VSVQRVHKIMQIQPLIIDQIPFYTLTSRHKSLFLNSAANVYTSQCIQDLIIFADTGFPRASVTLACTEDCACLLVLSHH